MGAAGAAVAHRFLAAKSTNVWRQQQQQQAVLSFLSEQSLEECGWSLLEHKKIGKSCKLEQALGVWLFMFLFFSLHLQSIARIIEFEF